MRITLLGFMGSGKTSIGKILAKKLDMPIIDLDEYIVEKEGMEINKIFEKKGEEHFRKLETKYLKKLVNEYEDLIIPLGGGTPINSKNWRHINMTKSVYLKRSEEFLYENLRNKKKKRPLIRKLSDKNLKKLITTKLSERKAHYNRSQIVVKAKKDNSKSDIAEDVIKALGLK